MYYILIILKFSKQIFEIDANYFKFPLHIFLLIDFEKIYLNLFFNECFMNTNFVTIATN